MEWFDNWFQYQCEKAWTRKQKGMNIHCEEGRVVAARIENDIIDHRTSYTIKMQPANGGTIIEVSHYDTRRDEWNKDLYIIEQGKEVGEEISKILVQYRLTHA